MSKVLLVSYSKLSHCIYIILNFPSHVCVIYLLDAFTIWAIAYNCLVLDLDFCTGV